MNVNLLLLKDILAKSSSSVEIASHVTYKEVTVRMWGRGVVLRREVLGSEIAASKRSLVRSGQFIFSRIDARHGAFGIVPKVLDGAVVTNDFPTYDIDTTIIYPEYLRWYAQSPGFIEICRKASEGTTNRARLSESKLLNSEIHLPPLNTQISIVAKIEELVSKLQFAHSLNTTCGEAPKAIKHSFLHQIFDQNLKECETIPFGSLMRRNRQLVELSRETLYSGIGTRMWGEGAYVHETKLGAEFNAERYKISTGQLVYNEVWAHNGAIAIVGTVPENSVVSRHFHVFDIDWTRLLPGYLSLVFRSPWFWNQCQDGSVGTSGRGHMRRQHLEAIKLPVPPLEVQQRIILEVSELNNKLSALGSLQTSVSVELETLTTSILKQAFRASETSKGLVITSR